MNQSSLSTPIPCNQSQCSLICTTTSTKYSVETKGGILMKKMEPQTPDKGRKIQSAKKSSTLHSRRTPMRGLALATETLRGPPTTFFDTREALEVTGFTERPCVWPKELAALSCTSTSFIPAEVWFSFPSPLRDKSSVLSGTSS